MARQVSRAFRSRAGGPASVLWRGPAAAAALLALGVTLSVGDAGAQSVDAPNAPPSDLQELDASPPVAPRVFDGPSWAAMVAGKTLYYQADFGLMGREYYPPGSNRAVFVYFDGSCYDGTWEEADGVFCFHYDARHCFRHFERDGVLIAQEMDGTEQIVTKMTDEVLSCAPDLLSERAGASLVAASSRDEAARP